MDGHKFDEIAKQLSAGTSRRRLLKGLAGGAAAAGLAVFGREKTEAASAKQCNAFCATQAGPGAGARFSQCTKACRTCGGPESLLFNCTTQQFECTCTPSVICEGSCAGTCCGPE